jgi:DNA excision repair protein ERCC-5
MGVNGLWDLLSPSARRTKIDQLQSKKIAIDTSIWLVQFSKAMRDDSGNLVEGAHLVGFFRRICKLLFYGIRPVFVFDGKPPALKKKTLMQRKQLQEQQMLGFKRTAEKLLLNKLKLKTLDFVQAKKRSKLERKNLTVPPGNIKVL